MHRSFPPLFAVLLGTLPLFGDQAQDAHLRRPTALVAVGNWIYTANRESGTISVLNIKDKTAVAEHEVGQRLSDMVACPDNQHLIALDEIEGQLICVRHTGDTVRVEHRHTVPPNPVTVRISPDGRWCSVASLWARQLTLIRLDRLLHGNTDDEREDLDRAQTLNLTFAPRAQCWLDAQQLIVADSFGGNRPLLQ